YTLGFANRISGLVHLRAGRAAEAGAALGRAEELFAALAAGDANPDYRDELGWVYQNQGHLAQTQRRADAAEPLDRKALATWGPPVADPVPIPRYLCGPGHVHHNLGWVAQGRPDGWAAAAGHYQKALDYRERLVASTPDHLMYLDELATTHNNLAVAYR